VLSYTLVLISTVL